MCVYMCVYVCMYVCMYVYPRITAWNIMKSQQGVGKPWQTWKEFNKTQ